MPFRWPGGSNLLAASDEVTRDADAAFGQASRLDLDVFLLHAQRADEHGNVEIYGSRGMDTTAAFAARRVLVTVEEIVPAAALGTLRNSFVLPRHFVHALSVVPAGAYPTSCLPYYTADFEQLAQVTAQSPPPPAAARPAVMNRLRAAAVLTHRAVRTAVAQECRTVSPAPPRPADSAATVDELMVCWLASQLGNESICSAGAVSPLAATSYLLAKATHAPDLAIFMTSGGLLDVAARPMLLSLGEALDTASAAAQCGGEDSYRWYYQQGRVSFEAVTVAQIDRRARTNNIEVTSPSGRRVRLPGQGGMADVADLHQDFVLTGGSARHPSAGVRRGQGTRRPAGRLHRRGAGPDRAGQPPRARRSEHAVMRIAVGQAARATHEYLAFARQIGAAGVQFNTPDLPGERRWEAADLIALPELGGVARIFRHVDALKRAADFWPGPGFGIELCLGTVSEMGGQQAVLDAIGYLAPRGKIAYVHLRDVRGAVPSFTECFLGEGNYHPPTVLRALRAGGFDGFILDDHTPALVGDSPYGHRGRAFALGYIQGLIEMMELDDREPEVAP
jgi:hypothetical protein